MITFWLNLIFKRLSDVFESSRRIDRRLESIENKVDKLQPTPAKVLIVTLTFGPPQDLPPTP